MDFCFSDYYYFAHIFLSESPSIEYSRNAMAFINNGINVTGIEISKQLLIWQGKTCLIIVSIMVQ